MSSYTYLGSGGKVGQVKHNCTFLINPAQRLLGFVSLLVTTNHRASSSSHQRLLKTLRQMASKPWMKGVSIHLLHIKEHAVGSPNLYLNLARLFASTDWVLIMPGEPEGYIPPKVSDIMSPAPHPSEYVLVSGNHSYPFPDLSPLLIHKTNDFWCSERVLATDSRTKDWSECLWQLNLETAGTLKTLNMSLTVPTPKEDERGSISEVCVIALSKVCVLSVIG
ncbi:hypothetical protein JR316_0001967 [Psilocybe cubensis]|uniref:Uncharacterized protein n=1 Tax=Psilocybe cubensis TaxID=181762 RepID=A0ACB8HAV4_PSICU|nr:hypothetical protein JR316_0001967 [Psilocybe cubensis]KAH9485061.1 hypothetical protein JR316_0001967 [Psilocybe cubensis]